jgi:hypothetical protein
MNYDESGEPRWIDPKSSRPITPHGLRATFRTWGEDVGFSRHLLEESDRDCGGASLSAYRQRALMQAWANFCSGKPIGRQGVRSASRVKRQPWRVATEPSEGFRATLLAWIITICQQDRFEQQLPIGDERPDLSHRSKKAI